MLPLAKKRILAFFFTALVVAPMFFFLPFTMGGEVSIVQAGTPGGAIVAPIDGVCGISNWEKVSNCFGNLVYFFVLYIPKFFFGVVSIVFDVLVAFSLSSGVIQNQAFVDKGWVIMRDLSNTFFIFILLYIAISTILQLAGGQTKRLLATLVMVALFMNFSLYITKFVIDIGNVFALEFYTSIASTETSPYIIISGPGAVQPKSIAAGFNTAFNIDDLPLANTNGNFWAKVFIFTFVGIMYLVAAFVFLTAGFLFLARVVSFWFLMILSPLAFFSMILPFTSRFWSRWSSELINQSFFAPIFLFFVYLALMLATAVTNESLFGVGGGSAFVAGSTVSFIPALIMAFLKFFAIITTLLFGLKTAKSMSGAIGASMESIGKTVTGTAVGAGIGASAAAYRQSIGWVASAAKEKYGKDLEKSKFGRAQLAVLNTAASGSGDVRAIGGVNKLAGMGGVSLGAAGGRGGYEAPVQKKRADNFKKVDTLANTDPAGAAKLLESLQDTGGSVGGINPNSEVFAAWSNLSNTKRNEIFANATDKQKILLTKMNKELGKGLTDKQKKQESVDMARFKNTEAKETIESLEGIKEEGDRKKYVEKLVSGDPITGVAGLNKEQRLALYKNMSAAQRAETETMSSQIFADINKETDLTKEELSRITGQDKKYKTEDVFKAEQKERATKLNTVLTEFTAGRRTDIEQGKREIQVFVDKMGDKEFAELEEPLLTHDMMMPHIKPADIAKIEKENRLTRGGRETLYAKLKDKGSSDTKEYLKNRDSAEPASRARGKFRGSGG